MPLVALAAPLPPGPVTLVVFVDCGFWFTTIGNVKVYIAGWPLPKNM
jgi:hypothetical protein